MEEALCMDQGLKAIHRRAQSELLRVQKEWLESKQAEGAERVLAEGVHYFEQVQEGLLRQVHDQTLSFLRNYRQAYSMTQGVMRLGSEEERRGFCELHRAETKLSEKLIIVPEGYGVPDALRYVKGLQGELLEQSSGVGTLTEIKSLLSGLKERAEKAPRGVLGGSILNEKSTILLTELVRVLSKSEIEQQVEERLKSRVKEKKCIS